MEHLQIAYENYYKSLRPLLVIILFALFNLTKEHYDEILYENKVWENIMSETLRKSENNNKQFLVTEFFAHIPEIEKDSNKRINNEIQIDSVKNYISFAPLENYCDCLDEINTSRLEHDSSLSLVMDSLSLSAASKRINEYQKTNTTIQYSAQNIKHLCLERLNFFADSIINTNKLHKNMGYVTVPFFGYEIPRTFFYVCLMTLFAYFVISSFRRLKILSQESYSLPGSKIKYYLKRENHQYTLPAKYALILSPFFYSIGISLIILLGFDKNSLSEELIMTEGFNTLFRNFMIISLILITLSSFTLVYYVWKTIRLSIYRKMWSNNKLYLDLRN